MKTSLDFLIFVFLAFRSHTFRLKSSISFIWFFPSLILPLLYFSVYQGIFLFSHERLIFWLFIGSLAWELFLWGQETRNIFGSRFSKTCLLSNTPPLEIRKKSFFIPSYCSFKNYHCNHWKVWSRRPFWWLSVEFSVYPNKKSFLTKFLLQCCWFDLLWSILNFMMRTHFGCVCNGILQDFVSNPLFFSPASNGLFGGNLIFYWEIPKDLLEIIS